MLRNYVGVSGVMNISDNVSTVNNFKSAGFSMDSSHIAMIGFLVINKTIKGIPPAKRKIPHQRYTPVSSLSTVMSYSKKDVLNMIHFGAKKDYKLGETIKNLFNTDGIYKKNLCRALQLNLSWSNPNELEKILNHFPEMSIVLQLPREVLKNQEKKILPTN